MNKSPHRSLLIPALLWAALVLAACTRPATTQTLPSITGGDGGSVDAAATEAAIAQMQALLIQGQTQTAEAALGLGFGGGGETALPSTSTPAPTEILLPTETPTPQGPNSYTVQPGDWLYQIARKHNVNPKDLIAANPQINANAVLVPGTVLTIPAPSASPVPGSTSTGERTHVVKAGENLFRIALNSGTTYQKLAELNGLVPPYTVYPGQVLKLP